jgi:hypothetical protein
MGRRSLPRWAPSRLVRLEVPRVEVQYPCARPFGCHKTRNLARVRLPSMGVGERRNLKSRKGDRMVQSYQLVSKCREAALKSGLPGAVPTTSWGSSVSQLRAVPERTARHCTLAMPKSPDVAVCSVGRGDVIQRRNVCNFDESVIEQCRRGSGTNNDRKQD